MKFNLHNITDGANKARVTYSTSPRIDGRAHVTIYAKDYDRALGVIFAGNGYENNTDTMTDYFERGTVRIFADSPLYPAALAAAKRADAAFDDRMEKLQAKRAARYA